MGGRMALGANRKRVGLPIALWGKSFANLIQDLPLKVTTLGSTHCSAVPIRLRRGTRYVPNQTHTIQVTVSDPNALRWGFELTARPDGSPAIEAGTLASADGTQTISVDIQPTV